MSRIGLPGSSLQPRHRHPSQLKMLDSEVIDTGLTLSDTLPGGVKYC